jgi:hypothetical protein
MFRTVGVGVVGVGETPRAAVWATWVTRNSGMERPVTTCAASQTGSFR